MTKALVLHSGGLDSTVCLGWARSEGYELWTVSFAYGQLHAAELAAAADVADAMGVPAARRRVLPLQQIFSGSALTGDGAVPLDRTESEIGAGIPATYVPARNLVFLSLATALAEPLGCGDIFIGVNALDYSGYPDCRPAFIAAFQAAARLGTTSPLRIHTPLIDKTKAEIARIGHDLGLPLDRTLSCYLGVRPACGRCDACLLRRKGFWEAGLEDPLPYRA